MNNDTILLGLMVFATIVEYYLLLLYIEELEQEEEWKNLNWYKKGLVIIYGIYYGFLEALPRC